MMNNAKAENYLQHRFNYRSHQLREFLDRHSPPDTLMIILTAIIVGVGTGLGAVVFIWLLKQINKFSLAVQITLGEVVGLLLVMGTAGLIVGYMVDRWAPEAKGHGVPEVMEAIALRGGRIRARVAAIKVLASAITIGSGGSAGREGPIVQTGSALGSTIGQLFHFSVERVRTLVACGAAAGIAATFNAPIAGAIFALEVIIGRFTTRYFGAVVISSVAASITARIFLGNKPAFDVPAYPFRPGETIIFIALGILSAFLAVTFIRMLYFFEETFDRWKLHPAFKASIGMLLTAVIALLLPGRLVLGPGLEFIGETIAHDFTIPLTTMFLLLIAKLLATSFTLGSGNSGGVFAPSLFMGAILGGMVGNVAHSFWPELAVNPGTYAIVGMAAVFAASAHAPITAVLIVFEMSNDYKLILPLMLATVVSTLLAEYLLSDSIYTLKLRLRGVTLQQGWDLDLMQSLKVKEVMTRDVFSAPTTLSLEELGEAFQRTHSHSFPVVDEQNRLMGMVSITDYERAIELDNHASLVVADIATMSSLMVAYENEPLSDAIQRLSVRGLSKIPVVTRDDTKHIVGVLRRHDIIKAYNIALMKRAKNQFDDLAQQRQIDGMEFIEIKILPDSPSANQALASLGANLPDDCVIVSIRREGEVFVPHGDTRLLPGDHVNCFVREDAEEKLLACIQGEVVEKDEG